MSCQSLMKHSRHDFFVQKQSLTSFRPEALLRIAAIAINKIPYNRRRHVASTRASFESAMD